MSETFSDNTVKRQFELDVDGQIVFANYKIDGNTLHINYVEAPSVLRGSGAAGRLMEAVMNLAKEKNYKVMPICSYAVSWLRRHDEYQDLLA